MQVYSTTMLSALFKPTSKAERYIHLYAVYDFFFPFRQEDLLFLVAFFHLLLLKQLSTALWRCVSFSFVSVSGRTPATWAGAYANQRS